MTKQNKKMTDAEARDVFNKMYSGATDADQKSKIEFLREFTLNKKFRKHVADTVFEITYNG